MSGASKVRLVRCPKCENLLQEPPELSAYRCGGCSTVLRARKKGLLDDEDLGVSDGEKSGGLPEKVDDNAAALVDDFKEEKAKEEIEPGGELDENVDEDDTLFSNKPFVLDNSGAATNLDIETGRAKRIGPKPDQNRKIRLSDDGLRHSSAVPNNNWVRDSVNSCFDINRGTYAGLMFDSELQQFMPLEGSLRSRPIVYPRNVDTDRLVSSLSNEDDDAGKRGFGNFSYPNEGPSDHDIGSYGTYAEQAKYEDRLDRLARVEILENDRAELLRKLDELAGQLTRSCNVADEPRETRFYDWRMPPTSTNSYDRDDAVRQAGTSMSYGVSKQPDVIHQPVSGHSYMPRSRGYASPMDRHRSSFLGSCLSSNHTQEYRGFGDVYHPQMFRRPAHQLPNKYFHEPYYQHFPARRMDFNRDLFMPEPHETFDHKPTCSCMHRVNNDHNVPHKFRPPVLSSQNETNNYANHISDCHINPIRYGPQGYAREEPNLHHLQSHDRHPLTRSSSDLGLETTGFGYWRSKKPVVSHRDRRVFLPIAGGAPFITCCNCSEVLKMSRKFMSMQEKQNKIKCGACSSVLLFEFKNKGIALSVPADADEVFVDISAATCLRHGQNLQDSHSLSSMTSEDEPSPDSVIVEKNIFHYSELISKDEVSFCPPDSPCDKYLDQPSSDSLLDRKGQGSESKDVDQGKVFSDGITSRQNSMKDALVATEMGVSYDDNSTNAVYHYSSDGSKDNDRSRINKGAESFFVGLVKKRFGDFSRSSKTTGNGRSNVSVNGHFIPHRVVKKAEKLAGPIQPGDYWYDHRAGFWGVMGHPCLGIILPSIDEFNYPMPENCAGGNTDIFLNGRELHQKDVDLLASRGLPTTRHKSYLIEISGRVVDEDTGEELDLGKLAPTVERAKRGFGMKVPKSILKQ